MEAWNKMIPNHLDLHKQSQWQTFLHSFFIDKMPGAQSYIWDRKREMFSTLELYAVYCMHCVCVCVLRAYFIQNSDNVL